MRSFTKTSLVVAGLLSLSLSIVPFTNTAFAQAPTDPARSPARTEPMATDDDDDDDGWGWVGLLGLLGLAGLMRRDNTRVHTTTDATARPRP